MDQDPPKPPGRKVKFAPKGPPRRAPKSAKTEVDDVADSDDVADQQDLSRRLRDQRSSRRGTIADKKPSVQVAFSHGAASSQIRTFGKQRKGGNQSDAAGVECLALDEQQTKQVSTASTAAFSGVGGFAGSTNASNLKKKKEYSEPWSQDSNYPITLPLRRPSSGNPELLDKEEFAKPVEHDENTINSASELGLLNEDSAPRMILFQLPKNLPVSSENKGKENARSIPSPGVLSAAPKGKEKVGSTPQAPAGVKGKGGNPPESVSSLEKLPPGCMGKMLVYRSGAVKLKLGDILYDVSPGADFTSAQNVVAIDTSNKDCVVLGELSNRAVVTPDVDSLLASE